MHDGQQRNHSEESSKIARLPVRLAEDEGDRVHANGQSRAPIDRMERDDGSQLEFVRPRNQISRAGKGARGAFESILHEYGDCKQHEIQPAPPTPGDERCPKECRLSQHNGGDAQCADKERHETLMPKNILEICAERCSEDSRFKREHRQRQDR